ncbi:MAG: glycosyltransferase family 9 protein, partial [Hyphomicrobiales bacterium]|nr:glycosyltransferase family 9 protein [Hyphomicrobiales bacterium]
LGQGIPEIAALGKSVPYLHSDRAETRSLKQALDRIRGLKVGLAWQGNPNQSTDADRSIPIARFEPVLGLEDVTIVSLQIGPGADGIDVFKDSHRVVDWPEAKAGLGNTANLVSALDLVITSDTSIAHLAGALGAPTWLLLSAKPSWRWLLGRNDTPWYPTMRLIRQTTFRDWTPV